MNGLNIQRFYKVSKLALYLAMLVLPGGFIGFLVLYWFRRGRREIGQLA